MATLFSEDNTKHANEMWRKWSFFNVKACGTYNKDCALKGYMISVSEWSFERFVTLKFSFKTLFTISMKLDKEQMYICESEII
jgi:hypothetical protein